MKKKNRKNPILGDWARNYHIWEYTIFGRIVKNNLFGYISAIIRNQNMIDTSLELYLQGAINEKTILKK